MGLQQPGRGKVKEFWEESKIVRAHHSLLMTLKTSFRIRPSLWALREKFILFHGWKHLFSQNRNVLPRCEKIKEVVNFLVNLDNQTVYVFVYRFFFITKQVFSGCQSTLSEHSRWECAVTLVLVFVVVISCSSLVVVVNVVVVTNQLLLECWGLSIYGKIWTKQHFAFVRH